MRFAFFIDRFRWTKKLHAVLCQSEGQKEWYAFGIFRKRMRMEDKQTNEWIFWCCIKRKIVYWICFSGSIIIRIWVRGVPV